MSGFNKAIICGNVGADPEVRSTTEGTRVATFSVATSEDWTDDKGQKRERTEWHRITVWNRGTRTLADLVERYVHKGDKILVDGTIRYKRWTDKENVERFTTEIEGKDITFLSSKREQAPLDEPVGR